VLREKLPSPNADPAQPVDIALPESRSPMHSLLMVLQSLAHGSSPVDDVWWGEVKVISRIKTLNELAARYAVSNLWQVWCQTQNWAFERTNDIERSIATAFALGDKECCKRLVGALGSDLSTGHPSFWPYKIASMFSFYDWYHINLAISENNLMLDGEGFLGSDLDGTIDWEEFVNAFPWDEHWEGRE
jgi:hypothetical protein